MSKKSIGGHNSADPILNVNLPNDLGQDQSVTGQLLGEEMYFDDKSGMLTMEKLYRDEDGKLAYGIISAIGHARERRAYKIEEKEESCIVTNGTLSLEFSYDELFELLAVALQSEQESVSRQVNEQVRRRLAANE
ncbi:conserved protein of unknown function [Pseudodesulfovibrio profundus]|uniref:Uncharacterized protein n=1 Tax=Pseudodesulfovibrio profundus TaxID=57320 RepID=A0A2C8F8L8_9BACT|nr:hypothetical protein [Pseudodesulfovibrio profundus]MBC17513.1 hypothetical protein [Desulfovibrio sp.]MBC18279.1 hypothetical protein [Desulfovibrio sp.]SOB58853.1 conserved protein of unknown function [Pseudodesulfovibrio profundus]